MVTPPFVVTFEGLTNRIPYTASFARWCNAYINYSITKKSLSISIDDIRAVNKPSFYKKTSLKMRKNMLFSTVL